MQTYVHDFRPEAPVHQSFRQRLMLIFKARSASDFPGKYTQKIFLTLRVPCRQPGYPHLKPVPLYENHCS